ncbi:MAG: acetylxylan esterase [Armatimonadetes bacterium]|nr:acetylxylan esterase [Armatimonadota bacterium]
MLLCALLVAGVLAAPANPQVLSIYARKGSAPIAFAAREVVSALAARGKKAVVINDSKAPAWCSIRLDDGPNEGFHIDRVADEWLIAGSDERGAMYGGLDLAEQIRLNGPDKVKPKGGSPSMPLRMIKFNIPLPGVGYASEESLRKNGWFYDLNYWRKYLEMMARNRYNALSLWSAHPYDRMLRLSKYPEACALTDEELAKNQKFFHTLFQMAKDHGVDVYLMTWNTHVSPAFAAAHKVAVNGADSPLVRDYTKECVRELLTQYPEITGFGTCPGEAMGNLNADQRMAFIRETYFEGIREAVEGGKGVQVLRYSGVREGDQRDLTPDQLSTSHLASHPLPEHRTPDHPTPENPNTPPRPYPPFILRYWGGTPESTDKMLAEAKYPGPVYLDIKFNGEHMYSSTRPHVQNKKWEQMAGKRYKLLWHLRNDDLFTLRWGDPDFAREMLGNVVGSPIQGRDAPGTHDRDGHATSAGFVMGSEIEIPGEDYIHTPKAAKHKDWKYEFEKQWFKWALWGRLGYNLKEPESTWIRTYQERFGDEAGPKVFAVMKSASKILPTVTAFHWNYMNGDWYPEGNVGPWNTSYEVPRQNFRDNRIFHSVEEWVWNNAIDGSYEDIPTYVMRGLSGTPSLLKGRVGVGMSRSRRLGAVAAPAQSLSANNSRRMALTHPPTPSLKRGGALSPIEVANKLESWASAFDKLRPNNFFDAGHANDKEWVCTMQDLRAVSELGHYYSAKILGATSYCRFLLTGDEASRTNALRHITRALAHWKKLAAIADAHYIEHEIWLQGQFSWGKYTADAERDVEIVKNAMPIPSTETTWLGSEGRKRLPTVAMRRFDSSSRKEIAPWLQYLSSLPVANVLHFPGSPSSVMTLGNYSTGLLAGTDSTWRITIRTPGVPNPGRLLFLTVTGKQVHRISRGDSELLTYECQLKSGRNDLTITRFPYSSPLSLTFAAEPMPWRTPVADLSAKDASKVTAPMVLTKGTAVDTYLHIPKGSGRGLDLATNKLKDNGRAEFPVEIKDAGKYVVHAYVNWPDTAGNSFFIEFDQPYRPTPLPPVLGNDDSFGNWHWVVSPAFDLKAGKHTLILRNREEGAKVARLVVAKQEGNVNTNNDDGGDLLTAKERNDFFHAIYERMTAVKPLDRFKTKAEWEAHARALRPKILNALGLWPLPKKVALDPHNSKKLVRDGYTVERVWYQVFPKVYASAYLYIPDAAKQPGAKLPAILHPHGHWPEGAADPVVQARCIAMAKMGYVSLCPDSTHVFDFPTGLNPVGQMTWDNIRGLDYLESLPYVDRNKLGCTGASGGGQQTMYLGAVDDRVKVLVPAVMVCYFKRILFETEDAHHFCNHVPGIAALADQTEMAAMFAPRPTLFICATGDWTLTVPKEEFPDMKHIWDLTGGDTKVVQFDKPHNFDQDSREQMYAWFNKYLKGDDDSAHAKEPKLKTEDPNTLRALGGPPSGASGHEGAVVYYRKTTRFKEPVLKSAVELESWRQDVFFGVRDRQQSLSWVFGLHMGYQGKSRRVGEFEIAGLKAEKWLMWTHSDDHIPCWYFPPKGRKRNGPGVVIAHPQGKRALLVERPWLVRSLLEKGIGVMAIDVHYRGEIKRDWRWNSMIWGSSEAGTAAEDMQIVRFDMTALPELGHGKVYIIGLGDLGVAALFANAIDSYGVGAAVDDIGLTYTAGRETPDLPGLLRYADLPQIAALAAPRKLWINGAREPFWFTRSAYGLLKAEKNLWITTKHTDEFDYSLAGWVLGK